jgi:hypothetical protein
MARLTDQTLAQSTAITPTTLIHIVYTGDPSQNPAGSSYKAELNQIAPIIGGYQYYSAVTISSGETLTLFTFPIEILPAPGTNKYYDLKVYFEYTYGTTPYTVGSGQPIRLINTSGNTLTVFSSIASISENFCVVANQNGGAFSFLGSINSNVRLFQPALDPIGGDGSLKIKIWYNVVDFG